MSINYNNYLKSSLLPLFIKKEHGGFPKALYNYKNGIFVLGNHYDISYLNKQILEDISHHENTSNKPKQPNVLYYCFIIMKADDRKLRSDKLVSYRLRIYNDTTPIDLKINLKENHDDFEIESNAVKKLKESLGLTSSIIDYPMFGRDPSTDIDTFIQKLQQHPELSHKKLILITNTKSPFHDMNMKGGRNIQRTHHKKYRRTRHKKQKRTRKH